MRLCLVCGNPFSIENTRGRPPKVCSAACRAERKNTQREESRERAAARGCPPDQHGTSTGYTHFKCPCVKCRRWARNYQQSRRTGTPIEPAVSAATHTRV